MVTNRFPEDLPAPALTPEDARKDIITLNNVTYGSVLSVVTTEVGERVGYLIVTTEDGRR